MSEGHTLTSAFQCAVRVTCLHSKSLAAACAEVALGRRDRAGECRKAANSAGMPRRTEHSHPPSEELKQHVEAAVYIVNRYLNLLECGLYSEALLVVTASKEIFKFGNI